MINYLFHASICVTLMYAVYALLFRRTTFFGWNRLYLIFTLVSSFVVPALTFSLPADTTALSYSYLQPVRNAVDITHYDEAGAVPGNTLVAAPDWSAVVSGLYVVVLIVLCLRHLRSIRFLLRLRRHKTGRADDGVRIVRTHLDFPFSFGNVIYLPSGMNDTMVIEHEKSHVKQAHWIDLLLLEAAVLVMWFNPVIYLVRRSLKSVHEYQADARAVSVCGDLPAYLSCLLQQVSINHSGLISPFFSNTFKQRINMITRNRTPRIFSVSYLLAAPALAILLAAFSFRHIQGSGDSATVGMNPALNVVIDPAHGGQDMGATAMDGTHEKDITLAVAKEIATAARKAGIQVTLTRQSDVGLTLAERTAVVKNAHADVFISIHADSNPDSPDENGSRIMVSGTKADALNQRLAKCLLNGMSEIPGLTKGGIEKGDPYVLKNSPVPAAIIELGFLSNQQDLARLSNREQQQTLAESITKGLLRYRDE
jgi:N-acetylmuramoyl-L-alanine amidase